MRPRVIWRTMMMAAVVTLVFCAGAAAKERPKMKTYSVGKISFQAPESGVQVREVGVNANEVALVGGDGEKRAWITLYTMSKDEVAQVPDAARLPTFKTTYLGTAKPAEKQVTREFLGHAVKGDFQQAKIPKPLALEAYEVRLPDGGSLFVGMRRPGSVPEEEAEAFFKAFASSLKVG